MKKIVLISSLSMLCLLSNLAFAQNEVLNAIEVQETATSFFDKLLGHLQMIESLNEPEKTEMINRINEISNKESPTEEDITYLKQDVLGFDNDEDFNVFYNSMYNIAVKYPDLENSSPLIDDVFNEFEDYNTIYSSNANSCIRACRRAYWARTIGVAAIGSACLPCGIVAAATNLAILIDCEGQCEKN